MILRMSANRGRPEVSGARPDNLPVERIVEPAPSACGKCGSERLHKLGEVVSKTLECEPRRWKIIEHVREKFSCRDCEAISEAPAPSHPIPRGFAGPSLLAMVAGQQVPAASAIEPPEPDLCPGRDRDRCLDTSGSGRGLRGGARPDY